MKKVIALCLIVMNLISATACFAFNDVSNNLKNITDTLANYSILNGYDDGTFRPDNTITRAEFAKIIICSANLFCDVGDIPTFNDIEEHWAKDYISMAKAKWIINGISDTQFAPDENLKNEQAIKMIVCLLGYKGDAEKAGGYPNGYIAIANKLGITKSLKLSPKDEAVRGNVAVMIYNSLDVCYRVMDENGNAVEDIADNLTLRKIQQDLLEISAFDTVDVG